MVCSILSFSKSRPGSADGRAGPGCDGAVEPPTTGRYEGSLIKQQSVRAFDRATCMTQLNGQRKYERIAVEGQRTLTALQDPRGRSSFEVFINYANALRDAGFRTDYSSSRGQGPRDMLFAGLGDDGAELGRALSVYSDACSAA